MTISSIENQFELRFAQNQVDIYAAFNLRYRVFVKELGGDGHAVDHEKGYEKDAFDPMCQHLILVDKRRERDQRKDYVIGANRMLSNRYSTFNNEFYTEGEFDLSTLKSMDAHLLEIGRSCIDANYRSGLTIHLLWKGLAQYILDHKVDFMFGTVSFHGADYRPHVAAMSFLHHRYACDPKLGIVSLDKKSPTVHWHSKENLKPAEIIRQLPELLKAYLRIGGKIGQGFFVDTAFNTVDLCLLFEIAKVNLNTAEFYTKRLQKR